MAYGPRAGSGRRVRDTGLLTTFQNNIAYMAIPSQQLCCHVRTARRHGYRRVLPRYLTHDAHTELLAPYLNSSMYAQTVNKPFLMFETNTASCGGFLAISDTFAAALWGLDYALQMAHSNFSGAMFHLGGQNVFYNPFTSPPTNESAFHQGSVGLLYYSALVMAEAIGPSNNTQVLDYGVENLSPYTPIYGIYENGTPVRVAIMNYLDDPTSTSNVSAVISIAGATIPSSVQAKRLSADSVTQKGNYTWAGQTFGTFFESDGRPIGQEVIETVNCDTTAATCTINVPAPGFALVFLNSDAATGDTAGTSLMTYPTTLSNYKTKNTASVDPLVLATSSGFQMSGHELAGTSKPPSAASRSAQASVVLAGVLIGAVVAMMGRAL
ncbi:hypothetical protein K438DRAFT_2007856 [Mycena galopus ATCC 62051]|nr:hypothetical protein K438DRAFT_2007856 [Mycena galopus ATCC 62051]